MRFGFYKSCFLLFNYNSFWNCLTRSKQIATKKNPPAYHTKCCAVKNIQNAKSGIATRRQLKPDITKTLGFLNFGKKSKASTTIKNTISCGFIFLFYFSLPPISNTVQSRDLSYYLSKDQLSPTSGAGK